MDDESGWMSDFSERMEKKQTHRPYPSAAITTILTMLLLWVKSSHVHPLCHCCFLHSLKHSSHQCSYRCSTQNKFGHLDSALRYCPSCSQGTFKVLSFSSVRTSVYKFRLIHTRLCMAFCYAADVHIQWSWRTSFLRRFIVFSFYTDITRDGNCSHATNDSTDLHFKRFTIEALISTVQQLYFTCIVQQVFQ